MWPMTLAPELAKLKGFLDATVEFPKKKMLVASQIHDSYGKMLQTTHGCKSVIPDCELWMNFGT